MHCTILYGLDKTILACAIGVIIWCIFNLIKFFIENYQRKKDKSDEEDD